MITSSNIAAIIADDLTGANDTALQFKLNGAETNIVLNNSVHSEKPNIPQAWAISTESRNIPPAEAFEKVKNATKLFCDELEPTYFYKKIDSTVRGNIVVEIMSILEVLEWDASLVIPAFPLENRITVGGYQLLNGVPIERTEMARDPHSPITESHLPTLLKNQLGQNLENLIGTIDLKTVMDGAGPILMRIKELVEDGKKIIIADSVSSTDIEQIVLAVKKSNYKILPAGNAATAKILSNVWFPKDDTVDNKPIYLPRLPKLIISGSATNITAHQIEKLEQNTDFREKCLFIDLSMNTVLSGVNDMLVQRIVDNLVDEKTVLVHTSNLLSSYDGFSEDIVKANITKAGLATTITDFLSLLTKNVLEKTQAILVTLGGETSYKCCNAIGANQLKLLDEVLPAIGLCKSANSEQFIVTKSGNLGDENVLSAILLYFENHVE